MSTRPICKVVANRPPTDALNGNMRRRSSTQVKKDLEAKIAAKAAVERSINTAKNQQQARIANLEDILWKEDLLQENQSIRPDLQAYAKLELDYSDLDENVDASDYLEVVASEGDLYTVCCIFH